MQGSNGDADIENTLVDTVGKQMVGRIENSMETYTLPYVNIHITICKTDSQWDSAV